jgi:hypothetical protein
MPHSKQNADEILAPHMDRLGKVFPTAWERWEQYGEAAPELRLQTCPRSQASLLSNFATYSAEELFADMAPEVVLTHQPGFLLMIFQSKLHVRLKKFRGAGSYLTSGIPTTQHDLFEMQQPTITGFPEASNCVHGYVLKADNSYFRETTIRCSTGKRLHWTIEVPLLEKGEVIEHRPAQALPAQDRDIVSPGLSSTIMDDRTEEGEVGG